MRHRPPSLAHHVVAVTGFLVLALWIASPVLGDFQGSVLGHARNDAWNHLWGYWYVADALLDGRLPTHTDLLVWPQGGSLWFIDAFNAVLTLPIQLLFGVVAAYNAACLLNFLLCGVGAYALSLRVTGSWWGALAAGLAYESTPQLLGQAYNGITETLSAGWLPLSLLALRQAVRSSGRRDAVIAGALLGVTALANWYYGLFAGMALLGLLARAAWRQQRRGARRSLRGPRTDAAVALLLGGGVCALVVTPVFALFLLSMGAEDAVVSRDPSFVWATLVLHNMTDALALVHPGKFYSPDLKESFGEDLIVVIYLGHFLLWPALVSVWAARRAVASWAALAGGYLVLTLGPFLYINGDYAVVAGGWIPLPFLALFEWFPVFSRISHAYRFAVGVTLALCVMLAWGIAHLEERRRGLPVAAAVLLLSAGRILESFYGSAAVFPIPASPLVVSPALRALAAQPPTVGAGAVLDLPVGIPVLARSHYALGQLVHQRPIPYGLNDPMPGVLWENRFTRYLIELEWSTTSTLPARLPWLDLMLGREAIMAAGLEWIVLHRDRYQPPQYARMVQFLDLVAVPIHDDGVLRIYRLKPE